MTVENYNFGSANLPATQTSDKPFTDKTVDGFNKRLNSAIGSVVKGDATLGKLMAEAIARKAHVASGYEDNANGFVQFWTDRVPVDEIKIGASVRKAVLPLLGVRKDKADGSAEVKWGGGLTTTAVAKLFGVTGKAIQNDTLSLGMRTLAIEKTTDANKAITDGTEEPEGDDSGEEKDPKPSKSEPKESVLSVVRELAGRITELSDDHFSELESLVTAERARRNEVTETVAPKQASRRTRKTTA